MASYWSGLSCRNGRRSAFTATTSHVERTDNVSPISNSNSIRPAIVSRETSGERWGDVAETVPRRGDKESPAASFARHADTDHVAAGETSATPEQFTSDGRSPPQPELLARLSRTGLRPGASTIPARSLRRAHFLTAQLEGDHVSRETRRMPIPHYTRIPPVPAAETGTTSHQ